MMQAPADKLKPDANKGLKLEDFIFALHSTVASLGGKVTLAALPEKYKELQGQEFRVEKFLYVANGRVDQALKRIPHVVLVKEENGETVIQNSQKLDIDKEELLRIDQKYRDRAAALRATKKREQVVSAEVSQEKRQKVQETPKTPPPAAPVAGKGKAAKAPPKPQAAVVQSKPAPPPPQKPFVATLQAPVTNLPKAGTPLVTREPSPRSRGEELQQLNQAEMTRKQDEPVVLHAILRLLEQQGPMSLSNLNDCFQTRWKCPFRPLSLGITDNNGVEK